MILKSFSNNFLVTFPKLDWFFTHILYPTFFIAFFSILAFFQLAFLLQENTPMVIFVPFLMMLLLVITTYFQVRSGNLSVQTLKLENNNLIVINSLFPFRHTKTYDNPILEIDAYTPWNPLTGRTIKSEHCRLLINKDTKLLNLYKKEELDKLLKNLKSST